MKRALLPLLFIPTAALAQERVFECDSADKKYPEMSVRLTKHDGTNTGRVTTADLDADVMVFPGLDALTFLYMGDGYSLNYNVSTQDGTFDYSASGSKSGWGKGTCTETPS